MSVLSKLFGKSNGKSAAEVSTQAAEAGAPAASDAKKDSELWRQVESVMDMIRPAVQMDGGDVVLVDVDDDGTVYVSMQGHCVGCPSSQMTLKMGIENTLKGHVPGVTQVVAV